MGRRGIRRGLASWAAVATLALLLVPAPAGAGSQVAGTHDFPGDLPGQTDARELSRTTVLGGLRVTLSTDKLTRHVQPFAHLLGGGAYERSEGLAPGWSSAWTFGGGLDIVPAPESVPWLVMRGQYDRRHAGGSDAGWYDQWSYGLVFRVD